VLSAVTVLVGASLALSVKQFAMVNVVLVTLWFAVALLLRRELHQRTTPKPGGPQPAPPQ